MRWFIVSVAAVVAIVAGVNVYIEHLAVTNPEQLLFADGTGFLIWAIFGACAWAPFTLLALYSLLRSPAGRRGGEGK